MADHHLPSPVVAFKFFLEITPEKSGASNPWKTKPFSRQMIDCRVNGFAILRQMIDCRVNGFLSIIILLTFHHFVFAFLRAWGFGVNLWWKILLNTIFIIIIFLSQDNLGTITLPLLIPSLLSF